MPRDNGEVGLNLEALLLVKREVPRQLNWDMKRPVGRWERLRVEEDDGSETKRKSKLFSGFTTSRRQTPTTFTVLEMDLSDLDLKLNLFMMRGLFTPQLRTLNLKKNPGFEGNIELLRGCVELRVLELSHTSIAGSIECLNRMLKLSKLNLQCCSRIDGDLDDITASSTLAVLRIGATGIEGSLEDLEVHERLRVLHLGHLSVNGDLEAVEAMPDLHELVADHTDVEGSVEKLVNCPKLRVLSLNYTRVSGNLDTFKDLPKLRTVGLCDTKVVGNLSLFEVCHDLHDIDVQGTGVTGDMIYLGGRSTVNAWRFYKNLPPKDEDAGGGGWEMLFEEASAADSEEFDNATQAQLEDGADLDDDEEKEDENATDGFFDYSTWDEAKLQTEAKARAANDGGGGQNDKTAADLIKQFIEEDVKFKAGTREKVKINDEVDFRTPGEQNWEAGEIIEVNKDQWWLVSVQISTEIKEMPLFFIRKVNRGREPDDRRYHQWRKGQLLAEARARGLRRSHAFGNYKFAHGNQAVLKMSEVHISYVIEMLQEHDEMHRDHVYERLKPTDEVEVRERGSDKWMHGEVVRVQDAHRVGRRGGRTKYVEESFDVKLSGEHKEERFGVARSLIRKFREVEESGGRRLAPSRRKPQEVVSTLSAAMSPIWSQRQDWRGQRSPNVDDQMVVQKEEEEEEEEEDEDEYFSGGADDYAGVPKDHIYDQWDYPDIELELRARGYKIGKVLKEKNIVVEAHILKLFRVRGIDTKAEDEQDYLAEAHILDLLKARHATEKSIEVEKNIMVTEARIRKLLKARNIDVEEALKEKNRSAESRDPSSPSKSQRLRDEKKVKAARKLVSDTREKINKVLRKVLQDHDAQQVVDKSKEPQGSYPHNADKYKRWPLKMGEYVEARYLADDDWFPARITRKNKLKHTYDISYEEDGDERLNVPRGLLRSLEHKQEPEENDDEDEYSERGDDVASAFGDEGSDENEEGDEEEDEEDEEDEDEDEDDEDDDDGSERNSEEIVEEDGDKEEDGEVEGSSTAADSDSQTFNVGMRVEANFKNKGKWYPGMIAKVRSNGTYNLHYDDGDKESKVPADRIRVDEESEGSEEGSDDEESNDEEEEENAEQREKAEGGPQKTVGNFSKMRSFISRKSFMGGPAPKSPAPKSPKKKEKKSSKDESTEGSEEDGGEDDDANNNNDDDDNNDDDAEAQDDEDRGDAEEAEPDVDDEAEALAAKLTEIGINEPEKFAKLLIKEQAADTWDALTKLPEERMMELQKQVGMSAKDQNILYEHCRDYRRSVKFAPVDLSTPPKAKLRKMKSPKGESDGTENKDDQSNASSPSDTRGRKIRAKRPSRFKTLSGFITRQPRLKKDPEADNDLEENGEDKDGEVEDSPAAAKDDSQTFTVGMHVEANYKNRGKFFPAVIAKIRSKGKYDLQYDDGDKESKVPADRIRADKEFEGEGGDDEEGDEGEVPDKAPKSKLNGEKSTAPGADEGEDSPAAEDGSQTFAVGMHIKANYKNKGKFYRGVIGKVRRNGTYDLQYDDGDKESKVPADRIRADQESEGKGSDDDGDGDYNEEEEEEEAPEKIPKLQLDRVKGQEP
jgi:hypothetical protein